MPPASADTRNDEPPAILDDDDDAGSPELRCCAARVGLVRNLISQLDMLLFAEIAALYYLEYDDPALSMIGLIETAT
jgi:hypothetical protein